MTNICVYVSSVTKSCLTLPPMDSSPSGSPVHAIPQAITLEWLPFPPPDDLPNLGTEPTSPASPRQHAKKQRHHFAGKGPYSQSYGFSMLGCESWTIRKAKDQRIVASELQYCGRVLSIPWTPRRSTIQS